MSYNKLTDNLDRDYDSSPNSFPVKPILVVLFLLLVALAVIYREPIINKLSELANDTKQLSEKKNVENVQEALAPEVSEEEEIAEVAVKDIVKTNHTETPATTTDTPEFQKLEEPKPELMSTPKIERFVDQQTGKYGLKDEATNKIVS